jgi:hypothetical protein
MDTKGPRKSRPSSIQTASRLRVALLLAVTVVGLAGSASAQPSRTFVASTGSDANAPAGCPRTAPCRGFQAALDAVAAGGEVVALDTAGYGPMTITKAVTVTSEAIHAAVTSSVDVAILINAPGGDVTIRNLRLVGAGGSIGVRSTAGVGRLYLDNLVISGFTDYGVVILAGRSFIHDTTVRGNGVVGILVQGPLTATLDRVQIEGQAFFGLAAVEGATVTVRDCVATGNGSAGLIADATGPTFLEVERCLVTRNGTGIRVASDLGATNTVRVSDTRIVGNTVGLAAAGTGTSVLLSFGDNKLAGNGTDGAFTGTIAKQ